MDASTLTTSEQTSAATLEMIDNEHWLASYIHGLIHIYSRGNGIDFASAETLLAQQKQAFEKDLATARRFYRLYQHLVDNPGRSQNVETAAGRAGA